LEVIHVNHAPKVGNTISDLTAKTNTVFNYTVPANIFSDIDQGDVLTYSIKLSNGQALPTWLSFNQSTRTLSGVPLKTDTITITITASDLAGAKASVDFTLRILNGPNGIENLEGIKFDVYPVPTNGQFTIRLDQYFIYQKATVRIFDMFGKSIIYQNVNNTSEVIDISNYSKGIYLIILEVNGNRLEKKIMKN
jgi:hypothetical protein